MNPAHYQISGPASLKALVNMQDAGNIFIGEQRMLVQWNGLLQRKLVTLAKEDLIVHTRSLQALSIIDLPEQLIPSAPTKITIWSTDNAMPTIAGAEHVTYVDCKGGGAIKREAFTIIKSTAYSRALIAWRDPADVPQRSVRGILITRPSQIERLIQKLEALMVER